jgi:hypothetical protein
MPLASLSRSKRRLEGDCDPLLSIGVSATNGGVDMMLMGGGVDPNKLDDAKRCVVRDEEEKRDQRILMVETCARDC